MTLSSTAAMADEPAADTGGGGDAAEQIRAAAAEERSKVTPTSGSGFLISVGASAAFAGFIGLIYPSDNSPYGSTQQNTGAAFRQTMSIGALTVGGLAIAGGAGWALASKDQKVTLHASQAPVVIGTAFLLIGTVLNVEAGDSLQGDNCLSSNCKSGNSTLQTAGTAVAVIGGLSLAGGLLWAAAGGGFGAPAPPPPSTSVFVGPTGIYGRF